MLEAARAKRSGSVWTWSWASWSATAARKSRRLLQGLDCCPAGTVSYHNVTLQEFDLDAALQHGPGLLLVDELAHTNAPGSRHAKRWQDVQELLEAGIDVYTTLNVQHLESLNDIIAQITGVTVRETLPDSNLELADEVELVDLPPQDLLERLAKARSTCRNRPSGRWSTSSACPT